MLVQTFCIYHACNFKPLYSCLLFFSVFLQFIPVLYIACTITVSV
ncbi:hypothetical protein HMPREF9406_3646 [Clostridium sp. HGF2]|nr:hypothetical protein HMPREF9406_3646 [Clostridium sp. HGF2]EQJ55827.1 putative membrane protein [Clostridioides difficile P28]